MNQPTHRARAEMALSRAEDASATAPHHATALASIATAHAVLAHLDALALPEPGTADTILDAARKLSDELGPNPDFHARAFAEAVQDHDHGGMTPGSDDHAQHHETPASSVAGATNPGVPVSLDAGNGRSQIRADLAEVVSPAIVGFTDVEREPVPEARGYALTLTSGGLLTDAVVEAILAAGWRPPLPDVERVDGGPGHRFHLSARIQASYRVGDGPYTDAVEVGPEPFTTVVRAWNLADACRAAAALPLANWTHEEPPARRVFFPGDIVPAGVAVQGDAGDVHRSTASWPLDEAAGWDRPAVEIPSLTDAEWQAAVDRARAERDFRLHLASVHKLANAFELPAADLDDVHHHDHTGPCGIRNHDIADRSYDEAVARAVVEEGDRG